MDCPNTSNDSDMEEKRDHRVEERRGTNHHLEAAPLKDAHASNTCQHVLFFLIIFIQ